MRVSDLDIKVETCGNELDRMEMMEIEKMVVIGMLEVKYFR